MLIAYAQLLSGKAGRQQCVRGLPKVDGHKRSGGHVQEEVVHVAVTHPGNVAPHADCSQAGDVGRPHAEEQLWTACRPQQSLPAPITHSMSKLWSHHKVM